MIKFIYFIFLLRNHILFLNIRKLVYTKIKFIFKIQKNKKKVDQQSFALIQGPIKSMPCLRTISKF